MPSSVSKLQLFHSDGIFVLKQNNCLMQLFKICNKSSLYSYISKQCLINLNSNVWTTLPKGKMIRLVRVHVRRVNCCENRHSLTDHSCVVCQSVVHFSSQWIKVKFAFNYLKISYYCYWHAARGTKWPEKHTFLFLYLQVESSHFILVIPVCKR